MYTTHNKVRIHDTDMAGILYFPRIYRFANDALEDFFANEKMTFHSSVREADVMFVIVHSEADYYSSLVAGDEVRVTLIVDRIGNTSFTLHYEIYKADHTHMGSIKTVHCCINKTTRKKVEVPSKLRKLLERFQVKEE